MQKISELISSIDDLRKDINKEIEKHYFILIDLANSTEFKIKNEELIWLSRLQEFYEIIKNSLDSPTTLKFLGDGVLASYKSSVYKAETVLNISQNVHKNIKQTNLLRKYGKSSELIIRIVLNVGNCFIFRFNSMGDPQGTTVDKL